MTITYTYRCTNSACEESHRIPRASGHEPTDYVSCPRCGGRAQRRYGVPGVVFRGSGWTGAQSNRRKDVHRE